MIATLSFAPLATFAHKPDTSYLRVTISEGEIEVRFTYDIVTLLRLAPLDGDEDGSVSREELALAVPTIRDYLESHVLFEVNMREADLRSGENFVWPEEAGEAIAREAYHQDLIHFPFRWRGNDTPEDFYVGFEVFEEFGPGHTVLGEIMHGEKQFEVIFDQFEPDYLYDTGYRAPWHRKMRNRAGGIAMHVVTHYPQFVILAFMIFISAITIRWKRRRASSSP